MSQRRMFSPDIVCSDEFLDMPISSRELYFQLGMRADDDGFVQPKSIMRLVGSSDDDLKVLLTKRFLLPFQSGVVVIKHWLIHNLIRADLYKETNYKKEKSLLGLNEYGAYTELREGVSEIKQIEEPEWLKRRRGEATYRKRTANVPYTALRLGKVRLGKVRLGKVRLGKVRREKKENHLSYLLEIPLEDVKEFTKQFRVTEQQLRLKGRQMYDWVKSTGKNKKDYKATLRNAVRTDFGERSLEEQEHINKPSIADMVREHQQKEATL